VLEEEADQAVTVDLKIIKRLSCTGYEDLFWDPDHSELIYSDLHRLTQIYIEVLI